ncbi:MAG: SMP-30/gluconolactonase/LRE family protein [Myxococcota bacterium]|nr:SMP-30/gluconolactonase/LRE family protein [Myxococcota bacterium]
MKPSRVFLLLLGLLLAVAPAAAQPPSFLEFESGPVRPLALSADGTRLYAVNTPDNRLEVFAVDAGGLTHLHDIPVGMEPVAVATRANGEVWVVNHLSDSVSIVDPAARRVVRTLLCGDEPRDIVFAGTTTERAFVTTARRGQQRTHPSLAAVEGAGDPGFTTSGLERADVWIFDADDPGDGVGGTPVKIMRFFTDTPRALAVNAAGNLVFVAGFQTGNATTLVHEAFVCDGFDPDTVCSPIPGIPGITSPGGNPGPATNHAGAPAPEVGLIVRFDRDSGRWLDELGRDFSFFVRFNLPDRDVFTINPDTLTQGANVSGVGTVLFNMVVNPVNGKAYVSNTEANNLERFEGSGVFGGSTVQGHLHEARITVIQGVTPSVRHLNKHLDYAQLAGDPGFDPTAKQHSLATPLEMAVSSDGATLYVAAFGSSRVGVIPTAQLENDSFDPTALSSGYIDVSGGGPAGLVLDETHDRLYVYTRFDNGVSVVDLASGSEVDHLTFYNPEPEHVVQGRPFLYDAQLTSSNGEASCSSCHVFGQFDGLAWDLGDPDGDVTQSPMGILFNPATLPPDINGTGNVDDFHPMKGPMTTQTLRGMSTHGAMHWRGDRSNGALGMDATDEDLSFRNFIVAFSGLLGRDGDISEPEMEQFSDFALSLTLPPNPVRALDNQPTPEEAAGESFYTSTPVDGGLTCQACHGLDPAQGFFGANGVASFEGNPQIFKVAHLRNLYQKVGMFGFFAGFGGGVGLTGNQVRGFGFSHSGAIDTLFRFVSAPQFNFPDDTSKREMEAFLLAFPSDLAPVVGQQVTLTSGNEADVSARIQLLIQRAGESFASAILGGTVTECDLVAKFSEGGSPRGFLFDPGAALFLPDGPGSGLTDAALRQKATVDGNPVTYTCVPPGSGQRVARDRDEDALLDGVETGTGVFVSADDTGSDPAAADTDLDGFDDGVEVAAGTDPNDPFDFPGGAAVPLLSGPALACLAGLLGAGGWLRARRERSAAP